MCQIYPETSPEFKTYVLPKAPHPGQKNPPAHCRRVHVPNALSTRILSVQNHSSWIQSPSLPMTSPPGGLGDLQGPSPPPHSPAGRAATPDGRWPAGFGPSRSWPLRIQPFRIEIKQKSRILRCGYGTVDVSHLRTPNTLSMHCLWYSMMSDGVPQSLAFLARPSTTFIRVSLVGCS